MAEFEIKADNRKEVLKALEDNAFRALTECGLVAEGYAKLNCPVDTGSLRNSIGNKVVDEGEEIACYIGTNMEYAPYVEFGTGQYYSGGRKTPWVYKDRNGWHMTNGSKPQPYIRPAIADHVTQYRQIIEKELRG